MAETTGIVEGTVMGVYIGDTLIAAALSKGFDMSLDMRDANNADTGNAKSKLPGRYGGSISGRSHFEFSAGYGYRDLFSAMKNRTKLTVLLSNDNAGDFEYDGEGYVTQLKATFPDHENSEYDWTIDLTGGIDETLIT